MKQIASSHWRIFNITFLKVCVLFTHVWMLGIYVNIGVQVYEHMHVGMEDINFWTQSRPV